MRNALTDEWDKRCVEKGREYAILTGEISKVWSGMTTRKYKKLKSLTKENLRDNMSDLALVLNMLAKATTTEISKREQPIFQSTGIAEEFGNGNPKYIMGMSSSELGEEVLKEAGIERLVPPSSENIKKHRDYWRGWILAFYQWYSKRPFSNIENNEHALVIVMNAPFGEYGEIFDNDGNVTLAHNGDYKLISVG